MAIDNRALAWLVAHQQGVIGRDQVIDAGLTPGALRHRIRTGGPWQRVLPGVYLTVTGQPTREQMQIASLLYAGPAGVLTGPAALAKLRCAR
ncbi:MAG: type IV toxin-antitoxin system AbiEi family antitoxin domain-containing protein [Streptosporangiaceae bacterium]